MRPILPRRLRHVPWWWWLAVTALAACTGILINHGVARAETAAARYGTSVPVLVATHTLNPGDVASSADARSEEWPSALLPKAKIATSVDGAIVTQRIPAGTPLTEVNVGVAGLGPVISLLNEGEQGVAVPVGDGTPPLRIGDNVDVMATIEQVASTTPATRVARQARVIAIGDDADTVAVRVAQVPAVTFALQSGKVTLVLTRPGSGSEE